MCARPIFSDHRDKSFDDSYLVQGQCTNCKKVQSVDRREDGPTCNACLYPVRRLSKTEIAEALRRFYR